MTKAKDILDEFDFKEEELVETPIPTPAKKVAVKEVQPQIIIQNVDPAIEKRRLDAERMRDADIAWNQLLASEPKLPLKSPKYYASLLSPFYAFTYNGTPVLVRLDGTTQYFPATIHAVIVEKLGLILDSHISETIMDDL